MKVLLVENIHPVAKDSLEACGFKVDLLDHAPTQEQYLKVLKDYDLLGIRSKSQITPEILKENSHLLAIGCFCIGTNQVDLQVAKENAVAVFNAPHSNTRSVAELVLAEMVALARQLGDKNTLAHQGSWKKSAKGSNEIRGKTLGIIGYGHIGSQVSILAEAFGLNVIFYDVSKRLPLGNANPTSSLKELLAQSDFVSLHVPETPDTQDMIGTKELSQMKAGSYLINASRGSVVEIEALKSALESGHIAGCAIDVFPVEPASNEDQFKSPLQGVKNVILTPHIGGSTEEAQHSIGLEVSESLRKFIQLGSTAGSVNFPNLDPVAREGSKRIVNVHKNVPGMLGQINNIISSNGINIEGQQLGTDKDIGYLVMDVQADQVNSLLAEIKKLDKSLITRLAQ